MAQKTVLLAEEDLEIRDILQDLLLFETPVVVKDIIATRGIPRR